MPRRSSTPDINETAFAVVQQATGETPPLEPPVRQKNPAAVALGRLGGVKGGKARAQKLSLERRREIAAKAAQKRWAKQQPTV